MFKQTIEGKYTSAIIFSPEEKIDEGCEKLITNITNDSSFTQPIRIMPDYHLGKGIVIGFTMPLGKRIIPNIVGVDIGCGVSSALLIESPYGWTDWKTLDKNIRESIPFGFKVHTNPDPIFLKSSMFFSHASNLFVEFIDKYDQKFGTSYLNKIDGYTPEWLINKCKQINIDLNYVLKSIGTLGGGNHFIEINQSEKTGKFWLTVHSGSRHFGLKIATYWQNVAIDNLTNKGKEIFREEVKKIVETTSDKENISLHIEELKTNLDIAHPKDLSYLEGWDMIEYFKDMIFAQCYASLNRETMLKEASMAIRTELVSSVESVHNYIDFEDMMIRKGAIRSHEKENLIIPLTPADGLILCEGKSDPEWNYSAPHGAGRVLSRSQAFKQVQIDDYKKSMKNVFSTSVCESTLDESPMAYKKAEDVIEAIQETVIMIDRLLPMQNLKDLGRKFKKKNG